VAEGCLELRRESLVKSGRVDSRGDANATVAIRFAGRGVKTLN
jgi:hypothetical protein